MLDAPGGGQWNLDQSSPRTELRSSPDSGNGGSGLAIVEDVMRQRAAGEASYDVVHIERVDGRDVVRVDRVVAATPKNDNINEIINIKKNSISKNTIAN